MLIGPNRPERYVAASPPPKLGGVGSGGEVNPESSETSGPLRVNSDPHPLPVDLLQPSPAIPDHVDVAVGGAVGAAHDVGT